MYLRNIDSLSETSAQRRQPSRCMSLELTVPGTLDALEELIRRWISTCVMSRTEIRAGVPIRREHALVTGNRSLKDLWNRILSQLKGQRITIFAQYTWAANRVESINFTTSATLPVVPTRPEPDSINRIVSRAFQLIKDAPLSKEQKGRIGCLLLRLLWRQGDDQFITGQGVLDFRNFTYKKKPDFSRAKQWLLPDYLISSGQKRPDAEILKTVIRIDEAIIDGRHKINQEFALMGGAVHVRVQELRNWVAAKQKDRFSIYYCYRP